MHRHFFFQIHFIFIFLLFFPFVFPSFTFPWTKYLALLFIVFIPSLFIRIYFHMFVLSMSYFLFLTIFHKVPSHPSFVLYFLVVRALANGKWSDRKAQIIPEWERVNGWTFSSLFLGEMNKFRLTDPDLKFRYQSQRPRDKCVPFSHKFFYSFDLISSDWRVFSSLPVWQGKGSTTFPTAIL